MACSTMTPQDAERLALDAFGRLSVGARFASMLLMTHQDERQCIIDGSQYSPSWRVLPEGERVYRAAGSSPFHEELIEAFEETLDHEIDQWSTRHEDTMLWDNGCLYVCGPEFDFQALT